MIVFAYGTDAGRLREATASLVTRYRATHGTAGNIFVLDLREESHVHEMESALSYRPFLTEPTFISISHAFADPAAAQRLAELLDSDVLAKEKETVILLSDPRNSTALKKSHKKLWNILVRHAAKKTEYEPLSRGALIRWMQSFCTERNCQLDTAVAGAVISRAGSDSWSLIQELAKLCAWQGSGTIPHEAVTLLIASPDSSDDVFTLTDALARRDKRSALRALAAQLHNGADPHYLLSMYAFTTRNLLMVSDLASRTLAPAAIAAKSGLHPFVVQKTMAAERNHDLTRLRLSHRWLAEADRATKDGAWDAHDTLYDFVLSVI